MNYLQQLGDVFTHDNYLIFFGRKKTDLIDFETHLPNSELYLLKQVHGDALQEGSTTIREGDAHWTDQAKKLLLIQTADCLPIMILSPETGKMLALHAGWRGVALKIVEKSMKALNLDQKKDVRVWVGPHIQRGSFEVQKDVAEQILGPYQVSLSDETYVDKSGERFKISLAELTRKQLVEMGVPREQIFISLTDTRLSGEHNSFRRGDRGGRNYSFITKL